MSAEGQRKGDHTLATTSAVVDAGPSAVGGIWVSTVLSHLRRFFDAAIIQGHGDGKFGGLGEFETGEGNPGTLHRNTTNGGSNNFDS